MNKEILNGSLFYSAESENHAIITAIKEHPNLNLVQDKIISDFKIDDLPLGDLDVLIIGNDVLDCDVHKELEESGRNLELIILHDETDVLNDKASRSTTHRLKSPFQENEFYDLIDKIRARKNSINGISISKDDFIIVKHELRNRKVLLEDLKYVQAQGDYIQLVGSDFSFLVLCTMKYFDSVLPEGRFKRIHKSYIVNISKIDKYTATAIELDNEVLPLSRNRKEALMAALKKTKIN